MPTRIYDIAKKIGVESGQVMAAAKELGIPARVPSSNVTAKAATTLEAHLRQQQTMCPTHLSPSDSTTLVTEINPITPASAQGASGSLHFNVTASGPWAATFLRQVESGKVSLSLSLDSRDNPLEDISFELVPVLTKGKSSELLRKQVDDRTRKLLLAAYRAASVEEEGGWVTLAEFGNVLKKLHPGFKPTQSGFSGLSELTQSLTDLFETKTDTSFPLPVIFIRPAEARGKAAPKPAQPPKPETLGRRERGRVLVLKNAYGFIKPDVGDENLYFHASDVVDPAMEKLSIGDTVTYFPGRNERSACAKSVRKEQAT